MAVDLSAYFAQFLDNIALGEPQVSRLNRVSGAVADFLRASYGLGRVNDVFMQGSYANHTAVEPVDGGEYDVDLVAVCVTDPAVSADSALEDLERRFWNDDQFRDRIHRPPKRPCVRLDFPKDEVGSFHVDVVPVRDIGQVTPPLEAPRRHEGWHETAPAEYTEWCRNQGELYRRTVMMMKRWRDEQQNVRTAIKSIVLQVLIADCMPHVTDDAARLAGTFQQLHVLLRSLDRPPQVLNPVLRKENLAERWTRESFRSFVIELNEAVQWADKAQASNDPVEAADSWRELLGDDFPVLSPTQLGIRLGDYSHAQTPAYRGWTEALDPAYSARITARQQRGRRGQNARPYTSDSIVFAPNKLRFKAHLTAPKHVDVWWQVANTGGHARESGALRGEIFRGRDLQDRETRDRTENWESTAYTGSHLIRTLLVRDNKVVAYSDWFKVNIYSRGNPFRL